MKYIVTSYYGPDLDGTSSMYAYSEYLNKTGKTSEYFVSKSPKKEVTVVLDMFKIDLIGAEKIIDSDNIIIVDTNNPFDIPAGIKHENVIEIIDHHTKDENIDMFINSKLQIEQVGAAATLIAEKFNNSNIPISRESAILLFYGIISNTINLKAKVTTKRDIDMANWLESQCLDIDRNKIKDIFLKKSEIGNNLRSELEVAVKIPINNYNFIIGQIEIVNVIDFLDNHSEKIESILKELESEPNVDCVFLNCIDIWKGFNTIIALDDKTKKVVENLLNVTFNNERAFTNNIIMRKEIVKLLKETY